MSKPTTARMAETFLVCLTAVRVDTISLKQRSDKSGYCEEKRLKSARMGDLFIEGNDGGLLSALRESQEGQLQLHRGNTCFSDEVCLSYLTRSRSWSLR